MSLNLQQYFTKHKNNNAILLCDETGILKSKTYGFLFDKSLNQLKHSLQDVLQPETQCVGLFLDSNNYIYLPFLIVILNELQQTFIVLKEEQTKNTSIKRLKINWIISLSDTPIPQFSVEKKIPLSCCDNKSITIWKSQLYNSPSTLYKSIFCVVQTSGTTGEPKVIRIPNSCIFPNAQDIKTIFNITNDDSIYWGTPFSFDPFLIELLITIISGASLIITPEATKFNPDKLFKTLFHSFNGITILQTVPSVFFRYSDEQVAQILNNSRLRILAFGGEQFPIDILNYTKQANLKLFNLYGITEVSCWATCHEVTQQPNSGLIPLGGLLTGIETEIRADGDGIVTNGEGELFIGSRSRFCLLNYEKWEEISGKRIFRPTGDLVRINNAEICYITRKNKVIKRFGSRVDLSEIENRVYNETSLKNKCIFVRNKLLLFIILNENKLSEKVRILDKLQVKLLKILPEYCVPDHTDIIPKVPLNEHGKISVELLEQTYIDGINDLFELDPIDLFKRLCCKYLGFNVFRNVDLVCKSFFELGGNSVLSIQFLSEFNEIYESQSGFLNVFFSGSLKCCLGYIQTHLFCKKERNHQSDGVNGETRHLSIKKMSIQWKYNFKACVDSPPFVHKFKDRTLITVGSFSNILAVVDEKGEEFLKLSLSDAIEGGAIASSCGQYLFVGTVDGSMNCIDLEKKEIAWKYLTHNKLKGSPCLIQNSTNLVFGCYDKSVYCLTRSNGGVVWKTTLDGSISSTPLYDDLKELIFIGTMSGSVFCLSTDGQIRWSFQSGSPIFSSFAFLNTFKDSILCLNVTGNLFCLQSENGLLQWRFQSNGNVFSSIRSFNNKCIFGSMNQCVYVLEVSIEKCKLIHKFMLDSAISTTPFVIDAKTFVTAANFGSLYILDLEKKSILSFHKFPSEIFSSPIVFENVIYVGCRDNNLYSLRIADEKERSIPV